MENKFVPWIYQVDQTKGDIIIAKFIGDGKDIQTKKWGIKKHCAYFVLLKRLNFLESWWKGFKIVAKINVDGKIVTCPYSSVKSFSENWMDMKEI